MPSNKQIPRFESQDQERAFWVAHDSSKYLDWSKAKQLSLSNLRPSTKTISLLQPDMLLEQLKLLANKRDVPYQSLPKIFLTERIDQELYEQQRLSIRDEESRN